MTVPNNEISRLQAEVVSIAQANNRIRTSQMSDFENLINHSYSLAQKNSNLPPTRLHVLRNRDVLNSEQWNDIHVFQNLNKTSTFNDVIREYKTNLATVDWEAHDYYKHMATSSKKLLDAALSLIYYTEGHSGLNKLSSTLPRPEADLSFTLTNFLPVYNTILYFAPFFLSVSALEGGQNLILHTPYELVSCDLIIYVQDFSATNHELNFISRTQLRLEAQYLPDAGHLRDLYNLHVQNRLHNINLLFSFTTRQLANYGPRVGVSGIMLGALRYVLDSEQAIVVRNNENQLVERESVRAIAEFIHNIIWPM